MPSCVKCGKPFKCDCGATVELTSTVPCALKKGAIWVYVSDDQPKDLPDVPVTARKAAVSSEGAPILTGDSGIAAFDPADPEAYVVTLVKVPETLAPDHDPPPSLTATVQPTAGEITYVHFELKRKAQLGVKIVPTEDEVKFLVGATVKVTALDSGNKSPDDKLTPELDGLADFGKLSSGKYKIAVTLGGKDPESFAVLTPELEVPLAPARKDPVIFEAVRLVKPMIDLPKGAVAVKKKHRTATRQSVVLKTDRPYSGKGTFRCTSDRVRFYGPDSSDPLAAEVVFEKVGDGITLEVEGALASDALDDVKMEWELDAKGGVAVGAAAKAALTAVEATISIAKSKDDGSALDEDARNGDGRVVHKQSSAKDLSRAHVKVTCAPAEWKGTLVLSRLDDKVTLFDAAKGGGEVGSPKDIDVGPDAQPFEAWVEGTTQSDAKADTGVRLEIKSLAEGKDKEADLAKVTVIFAELRIYPYKTSASEPTKLGDDAKKDPGQTVWKHSRVAIMAAQVLPADCPCEVEVKAKDDKVALYDADRAGNKVGASVTIASKDIPKDGKKWWAGGEATSSDKGTGFTLGVKGVDDVCDAVVITVKEIKATPKQADYTVVLNANGSVPGHPNDILKLDIEGPPDWIYDVQLQRAGSDELTGGPGLGSSWLSTTARADRPTKDVYSSFTTGSRDQLDGSGKATFTAPLEWWKDQARRKTSDFTTLDLHYRVVVVPDEAASSIGSSCEGGTPPSVELRNNLVSMTFTDSGYALSGGGTDWVAKHNISWEFEVRVAGTTTMYTVVQWKRGSAQYWPGPHYFQVKDYGLQHLADIPEWAIDRLQTEPRYHNGTFTISIDTKKAGSSDAPNMKTFATMSPGFRRYDFQTRLHLNFEVPASVTITRQEGGGEPYDVLIGELADPQPFELDNKAWSTRILLQNDGTLGHPDTYP